MTKPAFTPGPWKAECVGIMGDYSNPDDVYEVVADSEFGGRICEYAKEGDARLIAAAPELYKAMRELVVVADGTMDADSADAYGLTSAIQSARAALRKADGEDNANS